MNLIDMYNIGIYMVDIEYKIHPQHKIDNLMINKKWWWKL